MTLKKLYEIRKKIIVVLDNWAADNEAHMKELNSKDPGFWECFNNYLNGTYCSYR